MRNNNLTALLLSILCMAAINLKAAAQKDSGVVYFLQLPAEGRGSLLDRIGFATNIFIDSVFICKLHGDSYFSVGVPVGKHLFAVQLGGKKEFQGGSMKTVLQIERGKTYYIQAYSRSISSNGYTATEVYCKPLSEELALLMLPDLKLDKGCIKR